MTELVRPLSCLAFLLVFAAGCSTKNNHEHDHGSASDEWPAMDSFHTIMAEAFHPYKDSSNLAPIKMRAEELKAAGDKWAKSQLPEKVDNEGVKANLQQLNTDASALAELVKTGTDEEIGTALTKLHDLFHELQEAWYGEGDKHEHHH